MPHADAETTAARRRARPDAELSRSDDLQVRAFYLRAVREKDRTCLFVASTDALDSYGERVAQNWRLDRYLANPVVLWAHCSRELPIGKAVSCKVVGGQLEIDVEFASEKANPLAENVWQSILEKTLRAVSVGFYPNTIRVEREDDKDVLILDDNELFELSVTPIPANPEALAKMRARAVAVAPPSPAAERGAHTTGDTMTLEEMKAALAKKEAELAEAKAAHEADRTKLVATERSVADLQAAAKAMPATPVPAAAPAPKAAKDDDDGEEEEGAKTPEASAGKAAKPTAAEKLAAAELRAKAAEDALIDLSLNALIGTHIVPAEKDGLKALARADKPAFDKHIEALKAKAPMKLLGGSLLGADPTPHAGEVQANAVKDPSGELFAAVMQKAASSDGASLFEAVQAAAR